MQGKDFSYRRLSAAIAFLLLAVFVLPTAVMAAWWSLIERPGSWRSADWSSSGILPAPARNDAAVYLLAARTGGLKGAVSVHSWIVVKRPGNPLYERYDKVGWGNPVRRDAYPADGRWYSNRPAIVHAVHGRAAAAVIPGIDEAIASYPWSHRGDYRIWPGPNSNSFVAHVLRAVPEFGGALPPNAAGRDYAPGLAAFDIAPDWRDVHVTLGGLAGFAAGARSGLELHFMGLVAGFDFARPALKIPAYGRLELTSGT